MRFVSASLCLLASALSVSAAADACGDVDVFWGSGATALPEAEGIARGWSWEKAQCGNTHPGAVLPFGWVSVCAYTGGYSSGYGRLGVSGGGTPPVKTARMEGFGFTHFHQSGAGWCWVFYNLFRFAPAAIGADTSKPSSITDEKGSPGYYAASLPDHDLVDFFGHKIPDGAFQQ